LAYLARRIIHWAGTRGDNHFSADFFGGRKVLVHQQRWECQHIGDIVEAVADIIAWEPQSRFVIDVEQVPYRVAIFVAIDPPKRHGSRVGSFATVDIVERRLDPRRQCFPVLWAWLRRIGRRHIGNIDPYGDLLPNPPLPKYALGIGEIIERQSAFGVGTRMATRTVFLDQQAKGM